MYNIKKFSFEIVNKSNLLLFDEPFLCFQIHFCRTVVINFNEMKLVKEDEIEDKKRWSKNIGEKEERHLKRSNPDKLLLKSQLQHNV